MSATRPTIALDPVFLAYATRYALGRRSYSVADVTDALLEHAAELPANMRKVLVEDVQRALAEDAAGQQVDRERWVRALSALQAPDVPRIG